MNKQNLIHCLDMDLECLERAGKWASEEWFATKNRRDALVDEVARETGEVCYRTDF